MALFTLPNVQGKHLSTRGKSSLKASNPVTLTLNALTGGQYTGYGMRELSEIQLYERLPLVWRASRLRCNALQTIPRYIYAEKGDAEADWMFETDLAELIWQIEISLLFTGAAYALKNANAFGMLKDLEWLNPTTMYVEWNSSTRQRLFYQMVNGRRNPSSGYWTEEQVIFLREFSFADDIGPGTCAAQVALGDAGLAFAITKMAGVFFDHGAMPVTLVTAPQGFGPEQEKAEHFFAGMMTGIRNFARVLALRAPGIEVHTIQSVMKDLALPDLRAGAAKGVAAAFEIPAVFLDSDETFASSQAALKKMLYDETIVPRALWLDGQLTSKLLAPLGYRMESAPNELDLYKEDEVANSAAAKVFQEILNAARTYDEWIVTIETYGIDVSDEHKKMVEKAFSEKETQAAEQREATLEIARASTNAQQQAQQKPEGESGAAGVGLASGGNGNGNKPAPFGKSTAVLDDLGKWERAALKRVKNGGDMGFNSDAIPHTLKASILGALEASTSPDDVRSVFAHASAWMNYP